MSQRCCNNDSYGPFTLLEIQFELKLAVWAAASPDIEGQLAAWAAASPDIEGQLAAWAATTPST
jgi:hypothetical protein